MAEKTIEGVIYQALKNIVDQVKTETFKVAYEDIYNEVKNLTDATDSTIPNEHAMYSVEYGKITHKHIISRCRRVFIGENDRAYKTVGDKQIPFKALRFDKTTINQQGKAYEIIDSIRILDPDSDSDVGSNSDSGSNNPTSTESLKGAHNVNRKRVNRCTDRGK